MEETSNISVKVTLITSPWNTESINRLCNAINEQGKVEISEPLQLLRSLEQYVPTKVQVRSDGNKTTTYGETTDGSQFLKTTHKHLITDGSQFFFKKHYKTFDN